jgi:homoserine dehydrogenase
MEVNRIALLGMGKIGRKLVEYTHNNPYYNYVAFSDTSGTLVEEEAFDKTEISEILRMKETGNHLIDCRGKHEFYESTSNIHNCSEIDVLIDATNAQTYNILKKAVEYANVIVCNKIPIADVPYSKFQNLISKTENEGRILNFGATVGAGMRIPDIIETLGSNRIKSVTGCLSGTMNYVSQRINEECSLSTALTEAMKPPRHYTEPDPRVDLNGDDFARKLVIIGRICGKRVEKSMVNVEDLIPDQYKGSSINEFLGELQSIDYQMGNRIHQATREDKALWYLGTADLLKNKYRVGFEHVPIDDPITRCRESDNVLKLSLKGWNRPVLIMGPGAGPHETVTGLISTLSQKSRKPEEVKHNSISHLRRFQVSTLAR